MTTIAIHDQDETEIKRRLEKQLDRVAAIVNCGANLVVIIERQVFLIVFAWVLLKRIHSIHQRLCVECASQAKMNEFVTLFRSSRKMYLDNAKMSERLPLLRFLFYRQLIRISEEYEELAEDYSVGASPVIQKFVAGVGHAS